MTDTAKKILLAEPRGFCFGVENALKILNSALEQHVDKKIFVINEIVHNKTIVNEFKEKGVKFTQDNQEVPEDSIVIFSAHGVSPQTKEYFDPQKYEVIDATCPLVTKVHKEVTDYSKKGYHIIYIGNPDHDEAKGVIAENPENISVIADQNDIPKIKKGFEKYIVLTQTTLNVNTVGKLFEKIRDHLPSVEMPDKKDLCHATAERQLAAQKLAKQCDLCLILGSENSSNSKKLKEIVTENGCRAELIDNFEEIKNDWLKETHTIGITSGASAPEYLVQGVITYLKNNFGFSL